MFTNKLYPLIVVAYSSGTYCHVIAPNSWALNISFSLSISYVFILTIYLVGITVCGYLMIFMMKECFNYLPQHMVR